MVRDGPGATIHRWSGWPSGTGAPVRLSTRSKGRQVHPFQVVKHPLHQVRPAVVHQASGPGRHHRSRVAQVPPAGLLQLQAALGDLVVVVGGAGGARLPAEQQRPQLGVAAQGGAPGQVQAHHQHRFPAVAGGRAQDHRPGPLGRQAFRGIQGQVGHRHQVPLPAGLLHHQHGVPRGQVHGEPALGVGDGHRQGVLGPHPHQPVRVDPHARQPLAAALHPPGNRRGQGAQAQHPGNKQTYHGSNDTMEGS